MKITFQFPNGYAAEMTAAKEQNNFEGWVNTKFADRIRLLITDDFTLDIHDDHFIADFTYEDDGIAFIALIGGRQIDE